MKKKYPLVIVTVTYKSLKDLPEFVDSFLQHNELKNEARLIFVDNSPIEDRSIEAFIQKYPDFDYISCPDNPGFGAANNKGFDLYESDYVLFINNDVEFLEPVFKKLIIAHEKEPKLGCIGIHQEGGAPSYFRKMDAPKATDNSTFCDAHHFISGSFMFFKSKIFKEIGRFDPELFMYFEEYDISRRSIDLGYYTAHIPQLKFLHKTGNRRKVNESVWKSGIPSFCHLCKKYDLDPKYHSQGIMKRLRKLRLYYLIQLNFSEVSKITRIYNYRKRYVEKEFNIKL